MLLARISNLRGLCCIFQSFSMKQTIIANASPSLVLSSKISGKALLAAISDFTKSIFFWRIMGMHSARWFRDVKRWPCFQEMVAKCRLLKGDYLPSVELPQAHVDRVSLLEWKKNAFFHVCLISPISCWHISRLSCRQLDNSLVSYRVKRSKRNSISTPTPMYYCLCTKYRKPGLKRCRTK